MKGLLLLKNEAKNLGTICLDTDFEPSNEWPIKMVS